MFVIICLASFAISSKKLLTQERLIFRGGVKGKDVSDKSVVAAKTMLKIQEM